jgi:RHS repeat-associated protein
MTPSTGGTFLYTAENQLCNLGGSNCNSPVYLYDGDGNRVEKTGTKIYWYSGSEVLDETDTTGSITNSNFSEYIFFGGNRIARRDSSGDVFYYLADQLGSSRVIAQVLSGQTTATMCYDADFEPYGGEHAYINTCSQNYKFTGKERDTESGLDNFGARYYASTSGRFVTPDWALKPVSVPYAKFGDPQSLNLYSYVENSPLNRIDADGHSGGGNITASSGFCGNTSPGTVACITDVGGGRLKMLILDGGAGMDDDAPTKATWDGIAAKAQNKPKSAHKPKQKPQVVATSHVVLKNSQISKNQTLTTAKFGVGYKDAKGNVTPAPSDEKHTMSMAETYEKGQEGSASICSPACEWSVGGGAKQPFDSMYVTQGDNFILDKRFVIDNQAVQVYDVDTGKGGDYIRQVGNNGTTTLSYEKDQ